MSFDELIGEGVIERLPVAVDSDELADQLRRARHDVYVAQQVAGLDLDWAFTIAYNGILQAGLTFMYFKGFRPRGEAKHYNTFRFLAEALPKSMSGETRRLQRLRKKRNKAVYALGGEVSEQEATDVIAFSARFVVEIAGLLPVDIADKSGAAD